MSLNPYIFYQSHWLKVQIMVTDMEIWQIFCLPQLAVDIVGMRPQLVSCSDLELFVNYMYCSTLLEVYASTKTYLKYKSATVQQCEHVLSVQPCSQRLCDGELPAGPDLV